MYIITKLNCSTNKVEIMAVKEDELSAQTELISIISNETKNTDVVYETIVSDNTASMYKKNNGYVWTNKTLDKIIALHQIDF